MELWLHSLKVAQLLRSAACLHTNQSRSYLNHLVYRLYEVLLLLSYSLRSILYHFIYGCVLCMLLFNFVYYAFLLICLYILVVMYVPF